jgi:hypothetical protein
MNALKTRMQSAAAGIVLVVAITGVARAEPQEKQISLAPSDIAAMATAAQAPAPRASPASRRRFSRAIRQLPTRSRFASRRNVLLARCPEVPGDGVLQCSLVLRDHLRHAIKLLDPPRVGAGHIAGEEGLLRVEQILELVHGGIP